MKKKTRREKLGWDGSQGYISEALMHHSLPRTPRSKEQKIIRKIQDQIKAALYENFVHSVLRYAQNR
jgi:hypothetical protein